MELYDRLLARQATDNPIRVGLVGCGQMGSGFVHVHPTGAGMIAAAAVSDIDVHRPWPRTRRWACLRTPSS